MAKDACKLSPIQFRPHIGKESGIFCWAWASKLVPSWCSFYVPLRLDFWKIRGSESDWCQFGRTLKPTMAVAITDPYLNALWTQTFLKLPVILGPQLAYLEKTSKKLRWMSVLRQAWKFDLWLTLNSRTDRFWKGLTESIWRDIVWEIFYFIILYMIFFKSGRPFKPV